jgi:AAA family ATP:ADP antiporter
MSAKPANPLRSILDVRGPERPLAALMFAYFFLVITSFWILKPIKKTLFIQYYNPDGLSLLSWQLSGPQAELLAKVLNMVVAYVAVVAFTALSRRFRRQQLTFVFTGFFLACYVAYSAAIDEPSGALVWSFYLFGDLFSTLMVATFFAFLNDSVSPDAAKRLYGPVGLGGVVGGFFGASIVSAFIAKLSGAAWLGVTFGLGVAILLVAFAAGRVVDRNPPPQPEKAPDASDAPAGNPALEGARLVFRSRYLLAIVGVVGLYEIVSTVMDFQFTSTVVHYLDGPDIGQWFASVYALTNGVSLVIQLLLTSLVMTRFGVGVALLVLPIAALAGSTAFMALPVLFFGSALNTLDNSVSYSINQSAKEALYVPTTQQEKYRAKAFIDMFVQRFAKALAVGVSLAITITFDDFASVRWLGAFTAPVIVLWIFAARYAGRRFHEIEGHD